MLHDRIQKKLDEKNLKQADIARATGKSTAAVAKWLSGQNVPKTDSLVKIAQLLGVEPDWLATGEGEMTATTIDNLQNKINEIQGKIDGLELANPIKLAPIINEVQAGQFTEIGDDCFDEYEPTHHKDGDYWLRVKGDSMTPDFQQGDLILVSKNRMAVTGNYVVAIVDGEQKATFKKYRECFENGTQYHELIATNNFYPPIDSRIKHFAILGVVLEHKRVLV